MAHTTFLGFLPQKLIEIPDVQRPFSWGGEQVDDLIKDLLRIVEHLGEDPSSTRGAQHFFGTVVYLTKPGDSRIAIIDGQQRITAISVLLGVLHSEFELLKMEIGLIDDDESRHLVSRITGHSSEIKNSLKTHEDPNGVVYDRLIPSQEIKETYRAILNGLSMDIASEQDWPAKCLRKAVGNFRHQLIRHPELFVKKISEDRLNHLILVKRAVLECLIFVTVETGSANAVYDLFESLNAKGEPLNAVDLLKVWVMATMLGDPRSEQVAAQFRKLATPRTLSAKPVEYLRTYYAARLPGRKLNSKLNPKNTSLTVRKFLFQDSLYESEITTSIQTKIANEIATMEEWLPTYIHLVSKPPVYPYSTTAVLHTARYKALLTAPLEHLTALPLLLSSAQYLDTNEYFKLIHMIEKCYFRLKLICGKRETPLATAYNEIIKLQQSESYNFASATQILSDMLDRHAPEDEFRKKLPELLIYNVGEGPSRIRYFLWMLELYSGIPAPAPKHFDLQTLTVEHIHAQANEGFTLASEDDLHRLGNMCLLTSTENPSLGNKTFEEKKNTVEEWKRSGKALECHSSREVFADFVKWDSATIEMREAKLIDFAATRVFTV